MKTLARMFLWWPGLESDIENIVQYCTDCQLQRPSPTCAPLHLWQWPSQPWTRLHIDSAGPFMGHVFMVLIDSHSKWMEVVKMFSTTSQATISQLQHTFARFGLPSMLVSDNARVFTSEEFKEFLKQNRIYHVTSAPYHPSTNGLAERAAQTFKQGMKKFSRGTISDRLARFLFQYRNTPHTTTGSTSAKLLLGRRPQSRFDLILPDLSLKIIQKQLHQKISRDVKSRDRTFQVGDTVYVRAYLGGNAQWIPATILKRAGPVSCLVQVDDCTVFRQHLDQIHQRWVDTSDVQQPPALVPTRVVVPPPVRSTPTPMIVLVESRSEPELPPSVPEFHATESLPCSPTSSSNL